MSILHIHSKDKYVKLDRQVEHGIESLGRIYMDWTYAGNQCVETQRIFLQKMEEAGFRSFHARDDMSKVDNLGELAGLQRQMQVYRDVEKMDAYFVKKNNSPPEKLGENMVVCCFVQGNATELFAGSLQDGEYSDPPEHTIYLYLGSEYEQIPVGKEYESDLHAMYGLGGSNYPIRFIVKGHFTKGSRMMGQHMAMYNVYEGYHYTECLDDKIVMVYPLSPIEMMNTIGYFDKNGKSDEETEREIERIESELGVSLSYIPMKTKLELEMKDHGMSYRDIYRMEILDSLIPVVTGFMASAIFTLYTVRSDCYDVFSFRTFWPDAYDVIGKVWLLLLAYACLLFAAIMAVKRYTTRDRDIRSYLEE